MKRYALVITLLAILATTTLAAERWALLIGVDKCEDMGELKVCAKDAQALRDVLVNVGYPASHVKLLTDSDPTPATWPSQTTIEKRLQEVCQIAEAGDTVLVFFSGHGVLRGGESIIVPTDGGRDKGIPVAWLKSQLADCKATSKILILDACHSGGAKGVSGIAPDLKAGGNVTMLFSCDRDQYSWPDEANDHSVFTKFLLEGFSGKAAGPDRKVTRSGLFGYVKSRVREWSFEHNKAQTPVLGSDVPADQILAECPEQDVAIEPPKVQPSLPNPEPGKPLSAREEAFQGKLARAQAALNAGNLEEAVSLANEAAAIPGYSENLDVVWLVKSAREAIQKREAAQKAEVIRDPAVNRILSLIKNTPKQYVARYRVDIETTARAGGSRISEYAKEIEVRRSGEDIYYCRKDISTIGATTCALKSHSSCVGASSYMWTEYPDGKRTLDVKSDHGAVTSDYYDWVCAINSTAYDIACLAHRGPYAYDTFNVWLGAEENSIHAKEVVRDTTNEGEFQYNESGLLCAGKVESLSAQYHTVTTIKLTSLDITTPVKSKDFPQPPGKGFFGLF